MTRAEEVGRVLAVFDNRAAVAEAIRTLRAHGFDLQRISVLAERKVLKPAVSPATRANAIFKRGSEDTLDDDLEPAIRTFTAGGPALIAALIANGVAAASVGSIAGLMLASTTVKVGAASLARLVKRRFGRQVAERVQDPLSRGAILIWISAVDPGEIDKARRLLDALTPGRVNAIRS